MNFADGPITGRQANSHSRLYIQEGAIVEMSCKSPTTFRESIALNSANDYRGVWLLNYDQSGSSTTKVDSEIFEITDNWEKYHAFTVQESTSLGNYIRMTSKLRYTGRLEDNGKYLQCKTRNGSNPINNPSSNAALVILVVRRKLRAIL